MTRISKLGSLLFLLFLVCTCLITGCNTVQGFGQDLQQGGKDVQKAANDSK